METSSLIGEPRIWSVYVHTNRANEKKYIGITSVPPKQRWNNGLGYLKCSAMWKAIEKYGFDGFDHFVFPERFTKTEACVLEQVLIKALRSSVTEHGYNINEGGGTGSHGRTVSDETRRKISENHADISGENCFWYGKTRPEETRRKISETKKAKGQSVGGQNPAAKKVVCLNTGEVFECMSFAAKKYGTTKDSISVNCRRKNKYAGHSEDGEFMVWMFFDEYANASPQEISFLVEEAAAIKNRTRVVCVETGIVYDSYKKAAADVGVKDSTKIGIACRKASATCGSYHWMYFSEYEKMNGGGRL